MDNTKLPTVAEVRSPSGATWYVEIKDTDRVSTPPNPDPGRVPSDAQLIGAEDRLRDALAGLKGMLDTTATLASEAISKHAPAAIEIELNVGFTGKTSPVPFLVGAEAEASMKIKVTWKRDEKGG